MFSLINVYDRSIGVLETPLTGQSIEGYINKLISFTKYIVYRLYEVLNTLYTI